MVATGASALYWLRHHMATLGFIVLSIGVVLALWRTYEQGQERQGQLNDLQAATAYTCEVTKVLDSAIVQFQLIDQNALGRDLDPATRMWLLERIGVFGELHEALVDEKPCEMVE